jgi:hypothetical protein
MSPTEKQEILKDIACQREFIAGLKYGYNLGIDENHEAKNKIIETLSGQISEALRELMPSAP